ncbi:MAG: hypothetical protein JSW39_00965 [Desulfobacterales bacterium]|nr:MAG: hypothetical protein JSW39_00965 [Desulfobacterales bacterium]
MFLTATYQFDQSDDLTDVVQNRSGDIYSRWDNPTVKEVENALDLRLFLPGVDAQDRI